MKVELEEVLEVIESFRGREYFLLFNANAAPLPKAKVNAEVLDELIKEVKEVDKTKYYKCINCAQDIYFDNIVNTYRHKSGNPCCASNLTFAVPYPT